MFRIYEMSSVAANVTLVMSVHSVRRWCGGPMPGMGNFSVIFGAALDV